MKALKNLDLDSVVFLDIETANMVKELEKDTPLYTSWEWKMKFSRDKIADITDEGLKKLYLETGGLYPEFAKIICISIGVIKDNTLKVKSYFGDDEKELLQNFTDTMNKIIARNKNAIIAGHAIKGFDCPFIMRRCIVNGIEPNSLIDFGAAKPWEVTAVDTFELWKSTAFNSASLINIATALGIPSPKDDIGGYQVNETYYSGVEGSLARIAKYCEKDVLTVANVVRKCMFLPVIDFAAEALPEAEKTPLLTSLFNGGKYGVKEAKILSEAYLQLSDEEKAKTVTILKSIITKDSNFTEKHLEALINYKPKVVKKK